LTGPHFAYVCKNDVEPEGLNHVVILHKDTIYVASNKTYPFSDNKTNYMH